MKEFNWIYISGMIGAIILPFFSVPLIIKVVQRKSSEDISMLWAIGVFTCFVIMLPSALTSSDLIYKTYSLINIVLFSGVVYVTLKYKGGLKK
ncbi:MAG: hypothetical protein KBD53_00625 [Candidatus Omnitrophica bacterium]|nr:hypothetical protein [Candidatus Omnitrophota bacterium]